MSNEIKMYVYGSCHITEQLNSDETIGTGGYGLVISSNGKKIDEIAGGFSNTTNARMDIIAITEGLKRIKEPGNVVVYLTNGYVIDTLTKGWLEKWKRTGFKKKKHVDLWRELDKVLHDSSHTVSFRHSRDVKYTFEFKLAEQLGKAMSGKRNLPADLQLQTNGTGLFEPADEVILTTAENLGLINDEPIIDSVSVDASSIENPGRTEYRGVDTRTKQVLFEKKYEEATNNIGEFLAIVYALALYKKQGKELKVIYSDSLNAISWVRQKRCKTKLEKNERNAEVFDHIQRAINWLETNQYETKILKWNTAAWGQIPADYDRK